MVTPNEFRARIGLPPLDGGDELNKPLNNANNGGDPEDVPAGPDPAADDTAPDETDDDTEEIPSEDDPADENDKGGLAAVHKALEGNV